MADHNILELREEIYRQVMVANSYVKLGELRPNKKFESITDSGDEIANGDPFAPSTHAASSPPGISSLEEARKTESITEWDTEKEGPIEGERVFKREGKSEETEDVRDEERESGNNGHVLASASSARQNQESTSEDALAILRTCRQIYAEASPVYYSMLQVLITPEDVVNLRDKEEIVPRNPTMKRIHTDCMCHIQDTHHEEGIFETLGLASLLDFEAFTRIENISFDGEYNLLFMEDVPPVYVDEGFHISPNDEEKLIAFIKRTRTVENLVSLLATLPRLRSLEFILFLITPLDPRYYDEEDVEGHSVSFEKSRVVGERATELFMECGILDPLRKLTNVEDFDFLIETQARKLNKANSGIMVLKPEHAKMAQDLTETIEHNWTARNSIR